ncbi:MAG: phosphate/phosphite/phosphonate ABC transporter substrate-binding protein [Syntrophobacterales bacterium]|nr:phosphate/phosphite/phosphonate ABC transporter substrate-binding protein [Syntrophobacterales bacterium]
MLRRRNTKKFLVALSLCLAFATGCDTLETTAPPRPLQGEALNIGLLPEHNIFKQIRRYEPVTNYLAKKTGVPIRLRVLTYRGNVIENFQFLKLDGAFFGSFSYLLAHAQLGVTVLARPEYPDGTSSYNGLIFVRKDSGIRTVRQMQGKRLALVARATTAGYLFPSVFLKRAGVRNQAAFFKEIYNAGTHEGTIDDILDRKADVGVSKNTVYQRFAAENPRVHRELLILEKSDDVPENALALRQGIADSLKKKLVDALLAMHADPEGAKVLKAFGARRFIVTTDADYKPVMTYASELGIDLAGFKFPAEE